MDYQELIEALYDGHKLPKKKSMAMMKDMVDIIVGEVKNGNTVVIQGLGTFEPKVKAERRMYNPSSKAYQVIPESKSMGYKMHPSLKDLINGK